MAVRRRACDDAAMAVRLPILRMLALGPPGLRFARSARGRVLTGVVGGLAERWRVEPFTARLVAVLLGLAGGAGVVAYVVAWSLSTRPDERAAPEPYDVRRTAAVVCATAGVLLVLRRLLLWPGDAVMVPAMAAAAGAALLAWRYRPPDHERTRQMASGVIGIVFSGRISRLRVAAGGGLAGAGVLLLAGGHSPEAIAGAAQSVLLAMVGATIVLGPWVGRLVEQLNLERRERIRSEERAAMTAHLHDSVLQTLALIQRSPGDPRRMVRLARRQERELRAWLYGDQQSLAGARSLGTAAETLAQDVETDHDVRVDLVVVGDHVLDDRAGALLSAVREAVVNAAKHAAVDSISVYLEVEPGLLTAFVRDRGRGFDVARVPPDRHGIADSIRGRLERAGGRAVVVSAPGEGTEVQLSLPVVESRPE
jgi:signal transduction histidine kinase/phage shock protein PspC (stress-responsive transcriptional regulator)